MIHVPWDMGYRNVGKPRASGDDPRDIEVTLMRPR